MLNKIVPMHHDDFEIIEVLIEPIEETSSGAEKKSIDYSDITRITVNGRHDDKTE